MATSREYAFYLDGNRLSIVERDYSLADGLNYTHTEGDGLGLATGSGYWKSPSTTISDGIQLEYTASPKAKDGGEITDESDDVNITSYLSKALVYYVKARIAEDAMEIETKEYFMAQFRKMIEKNENARFTGYRHVVPGAHAIL